MCTDPCMGLMMRMQSECNLHEGQMPSCDGSCPGFYRNATMVCATTPDTDENGQPKVDENGQAMMLSTVFEGLQKMCDGGSNESNCTAAFNVGKGLCENVEPDAMCDPNGKCFPAIQSLIG